MVSSCSLHSPYMSCNLSLLPLLVSFFFSFVGRIDGIARNNPPQQPPIHAINTFSGDIFRASAALDIFILPMINGLITVIVVWRRKVKYN